MSLGDQIVQALEKFSEDLVDGKPLRVTTLTYNGRTYTIKKAKMPKNRNNMLTLAKEVVSKLEHGPFNKRAIRELRKNAKKLSRGMRKLRVSREKTVPPS